MILRRLITIIMSKLILLLFFVALFAQTSSGVSVLSPLSYWKNVLPDTYMPDALQASLPKGSIPGRYGGRSARIAKCCFSYSDMIRIRSHFPKGLFFSERGLKPGTAMNISFFTAANINSDQEMPTFLPRQAAEALPFSTSSFSTILQRLSLSPASPEASAMKETIEQCEMPDTKGETSFCATSLESMVDFATAQLGTNNLQILSTLVPHGKKTSKQLDFPYVVQPGIVKMDSPVALACHGMPYPYAVFYCHKTMDTRSYIVPLMAVEDGSRVDAVVVCHADTSQWDPRHASFKELGVKPGTVSICYFLPLNSFLWISK